VIAGRYTKIREFGRGGMGVVWLAEDEVIGRRVALKELRTTEDEVASIGLQTLNALEAAHAAGIVDRDVKPSNIMVAPDGTVKLTDFGIARAVDDPRLTASGGIMGSPGYMAPELFAGRPPSPATDQWALGATMFHAIEGHSPFQRDTTAATMHAIMYDEPVIRRARGTSSQTSSQAPSSTPKTTQVQAQPVPHPSRSARPGRSPAGTTASTTSRPRKASRASPRSSTRWTAPRAGSQPSRNLAPASSTPARSARPATT
jgi:serine/threonine protein kinase